MPLDSSPATKADAPVEAEGMGEDELLAMLRTEEADASSFYTSEVAADQATAMERYYAAPYGDEVAGRSAITTHDIQDTVNWMMPGLMRLFFGADELVSCEPERESDAENCKPAAQYLEHILLRDNPGTTIIHDFIFDGLVQRIGFVSVMWADPKPGVPRKFDGMGVEQLLKMHSDPAWEIVSVDADESEMPTDGEQAGLVLPTFAVEARRVTKIGRVKILGVPSEEMAWSRRARSIDTADYVRRKQVRFLSEVAKENPEQADKLGASPSASDDAADTDPRITARHPSESIAIGTDGQSLGRKKVDYLTEWIWVDYDGDGTVELRRVERVGDVILANDPVDRCELVSWSPIRVAHKLVGLSIADTIIGLQKIRTVITRKILDSLSQSLTPRNAINTQMVDEAAVDDILDAVVGGVVRVNGDVRAALQPLVTPDVTPAGMQALEYFDQKSEQASGVTRHSQGLQPDAITKTAAGIENLQAAAGERTELVANWAGMAVEAILQRCLSLVVDHQGGPRWLQLGGKPATIDPRMWSDEMAVKVHVGKVGSSRQQHLGNLSGIAAKQEQAIQVGGPDNPVCTVKHLLHTYSRMSEAMGFKDATKFWKSEEEADASLQQAASQPPKPDPKMVEVQQKGDLAKAELEQKGQQHAAEQQQAQASAAAAQQADQAKAVAEHQFKMQLAAAQLQAEQQATQAKAESDQRLAAIKFEMEERVAIAKLNAETQLAQLKLQTEVQLAEQKMANELVMARYQAKHQAKAAKSKSSASKSDGIEGFRPGGALDA